MQFLILAHDTRDEGAMARRMAARAEHIATIDRYRKAGHMHIGAALLDDVGKMCGSVIIAEFPSRKELEAWLAEEPYLTANVWRRVEIQPCQIGPSFLKEKAA